MLWAKYEIRIVYPVIMQFLDRIKPENMGELITACQEVAQSLGKYCYSCVHCTSLILAPQWYYYRVLDLHINNI